MEILIITQKVDKNDPILGFFHRWLEELSKHFERLIVICLEKPARTTEVVQSGGGEYDLPANVEVLSLGKESQNSGDMIYHITLQRLIYLARFYKYIWQKRAQYSHIFVHMNQEYVLLGWKFWKLWGKKVYLWRNHKKGNFATRLAVFLSDKVFYTSPQSFTAKFNSPRRSLWRSAGNAVQMPVGIDTDFFKPDPSVERASNTVLFLGRISPVKKVIEFIDWVGDTNYTATIAGPILPQDMEYGEIVKHRMLDNKIKYVGPVTQEEARKLYQTHEIYVNFTPSGSMDKTTLEAAACGARVMVENSDLKMLESMKAKELRSFVVENHSLNKLIEKLKREFFILEKNEKGN